MTTKLPPVRLSLEAEDSQSWHMVPWFNYRVINPKKPLPSASARPHIKTERLIVRPILPTDLEAFHHLRSQEATQIHSPSRGRPDRDLEETRQNIEKLQPPHDLHHWYWGAFLISNGEMIGEGGFPDVEIMPRSGWPEIEVLIRPDHWRQGYGTEFYHAIIDSWWGLPGEKKNHQLHPMIMQGRYEPGDLVEECVGFAWEEGNVAATGFFAKILGQATMAVEGLLVDFDTREGREGNLVRWTGGATTIPTPRPLAASTRRFF